MKRILTLQDGSVVQGDSFGAKSNASGEVVFNTSMVGYPEMLTDPSYAGQILVLAYPMIGNYGVPEQKIIDELESLESKNIHIKGLVVADYSQCYNHWEAHQSLSEWLAEHNIPGISGVDTRALIKKLRDGGVQLGSIEDEQSVSFYDPNKQNLVEQVSIKQKKTYGSGDTKILLVDCGCKNNIIRCFLKRNCTVVRVPFDYDFTSEEYDGLFISNGPGDPTMCTKTIAHLKKAMEEDKPIFGICLGNQLLALAAGAKTYKLKFGHRSSNQPCINMKTNRCYITTQNHGFAVDSSSLPHEFEVWFENANDKTNEGICHKTKPIRSVQFHPEACAGPTDTEFLFDEFVEQVRSYKQEKKQ